VALKRAVHTLEGHPELACAPRAAPARFSRDDHFVPSQQHTHTHKHTHTHTASTLNLGPSRAPKTGVSKIGRRARADGPDDLQARQPRKEPSCRRRAPVEVQNDLCGAAGRIHPDIYPRDDRRKRLEKLVCV
jgi:hypothetical protein